jgi:hypothetical protein
MEPRRATLPTPEELREQSRRFRDAARNAAEAATKRRLAAHAAALAQIAEALDRESQGVHPEKTQRYQGLLAGPLAEEVLRVVGELLEPKAARDLRRRIEVWRQRAEELRATADTFSVPSAQDALRRAAANYDRIADNAESLLPLPSGKTG